MCSYRGEKGGSSTCTCPTCAAACKVQTRAELLLSTSQREALAFDTRKQPGAAHPVLWYHEHCAVGWWDTGQERRRAVRSPAVHVSTCCHEQLCHCSVAYSHTNEV